MQNFSTLCVSWSLFLWCLDFWISTITSASFIIHTDYISQVILSTPLHLGACCRNTGFRFLFRSPWAHTHIISQVCVDFFASRGLLKKQFWGLCFADLGWRVFVLLTLGEGSLFCWPWVKGLCFADLGWRVFVLLTLGKGSLFCWPWVKGLCFTHLGWRVFQDGGEQGLHLGGVACCWGVWDEERPVTKHQTVVHHL